MKRRLLGWLAALTLCAIWSGTAMAYGRVVVGGFYGGHGRVDYYGGWQGYHGGWRGAYWGPGAGFYIGAPAYWGGWPYAYSYGYIPYATSYAVAPTVYVEQPVEGAPLPAQSHPDPPSVAGNAGSPPTFWFYCTQPAGYYPYVRDCSQAWIRVLPQADTSVKTRPKLAQ
ncbi:MAG: hypothetical protein J5X22_18245 [Candidatus Accumulibacter sp.]|uniref:Uncharacterized protein n=1 Tax=Candidatus Accumulibacter cognatus TaxID=2954383 RepID=A0A080M8Q8_9PROT|nr:hypothetical protein [Accumulibacter sp.]KFB77608.1 MAG: hypothetical protein AW06_001302 [Candidatus Accumulibacter cognatus]MBO3712356.1 hypothetical protein [Accumulibacter sp.]